MVMDSRQPRPLDAAYTSPSKQETDDYKLASDSMDDDEDYGSGYRAPATNPNKKNRKKLAIVLIVVLLLALGAAGYELFKHRHVATKTPAKTSTTTSAQPPPQTSTNSSTTTHYVSNGKDLNLEFDYPSSWTVTPASANNANDQAIVLNSPSTTLTVADGTSQTGKVTVNIRPGSATITELAAGMATAAQTSAQFAYKNPTPSQHQYPYLAFMHFGSSSSAASAQSTNSTGAFEEVMITGITQFNKGDAISAASLNQLDPIISVSFYHCATTACAGQAAGSLSITADNWQNNSLFQQVQALFASLKLN